ncbi:drosocin [Drosophila sechellia]|uniref:Drosocin antimicrobial peptides n=3 Tax=melanogaster subgroup TaxID=32351 RepID=DROS_DROSI|nr:drosocin [Drosophila sechellia]XP_033155599.1 drosocin [Drosophila mauritiana]Q6XMH8.1 RecName: Full=Drosocin antimicrobial peptides; Contains: RecName: Full=Drosocin; Contains: RecName: Full=Buletin; Flags: Precursor [Drosophila simulans]AAO72465.1 drosocin [Drosophila melanogaster]AAO72467.1 drosocin [Drosophila melanogaster]AAO72473.1 drosocin [Drosophila melanogaster]AAO72474.1 drosocin [Drosophila melanogaster]AAO72475.1 drosocin [Drosophila melanogaster]
MKFTIVFLLLACVFAMAVATPGKPRPYSPRPTSHPRPIRVRREALAIEDHLAQAAIRPPPILPA